MKNWPTYYAFALFIIATSACSPDDEVPIETKPEFAFSVVDDTAYFQILSTGYQSIEWDFGDGTTSNKPNPAHGYKKSGQYEVYLRVRTPKNTISNENLYRSKIPMVDRADYKENFTSKTVMIYYQPPIPAKVYEVVNVGFSHINTLIDWGNPVSGKFENYFEFAFDSLFTQPAYGFLRGNDIFAHITGSGKLDYVGNSWFDIRLLTPGTTYFYRVRQEYIPQNGPNKTYYSRTVKATLNDFPTGQIVKKPSDAIVSNYDLEFNQDDPFFEITVNNTISLSSDFSKPFKPFVYSTSQAFNNYVTLGETVYMRSRYFYRHDSINFNYEVIETHTSNEKYLAKHYDQNDEVFRGNDVKVEQKNGATYVTLGINTTEKVVLYLKNLTLDKYYYLQSESENQNENYALYYNEKGEKYRISDRARLYVYIEKIEGTNFSICLLKDQNNRSYVEFKNPTTDEYKGFDGFLYRVEE